MQMMDMLARAFFFVMSLQLVRSQYSYYAYGGNGYGYEPTYLYGNQYAIYLTMVPVYGGSRKMFAYHSTVEVPTYYSPEIPTNYSPEVPTYYLPEVPTSSPEVPTSSPEVPTYYSPEIPTSSPEVEIPTLSPEIPTSSPENPDEYTNDLDNVYNPENNGSQDNTTNTNDDNDNDNDNNNFDDTNFDDENDSKNEDVKAPSPPPAKNMSNIVIAQLSIFLSLCLFAMNI